MLRNRFSAAAAALILTSMVAWASAAGADDRRFEIGGNVGWTASDGVTSNGVLAGDNALYNGIEPKDSISFALSLGYFVSDNVQVGAFWDRQSSKLQITGSQDFEIG